MPAHLRRHVVEQDYAAYDAVDHAVWRFVLTQLYERLSRDAHPAYARGLAQTGMSVERIPRISEMDACLARFGWGAVCVDGFIPPRAFQELQALGLLPIAAAIRSVEHLPYTPAPDIIHEAGGHAPILPDPDYAAFLRAIGEHGMRSFGSAHDGALYETMRRLSVLKERPDADAREVELTERALAALAASAAEPSEAMRLSRLYWWTVEYGLVGTPSNYRLYGAGLLSSLGESHFCHSKAVRKLPLDRGCADVGYDITRPQPQLFVARDFAELRSVLDEVTAGFAFRRGGIEGLRTASAAGELASVLLDSGLYVTGEVRGVREREGEVLGIEFGGPCGLGRSGRLFADDRAGARADGLVAVLGARADGRALESLRERELGSAGARLMVRLASGIRLEGTLRAAVRGTGGLEAVVLERARVFEGDAALFARDAGTVVWLAGRSIPSVRAGAEDANFHAGSEFPRTTAPVPKRGASEQARLRRLYRCAALARGVEATRATRCAKTIHRRLAGASPYAWLLRFELLELLAARDLAPELCDVLVAELEELEVQLRGEQPITTGLRRLGRVRGSGTPPRLSGLPTWR